MFASICRRRLFRLCQIPFGTGAIPSDALPHCHSLATIADAPVSEPCAALVSCGLSPAAAVAHKLPIRSTAKADAVRALLRSYGFTDAEVADLVRRLSQILSVDPDRIRPKLDLFASLGVKPRRLARYPALLTRSLDKHLVPCIQFLRNILSTDEDVCLAISRTPRALSAGLEKIMRPAVDTLRRLGLPDESISKLVVIEMGVLMMSPDRICQIFEALKEFGLGVTEKRFPYGIRALCCISREKWLHRVALYRSFGVSEGELQRAFKKQPNIVNFSDEIIKKKIRFFLDVLKLELSEVMEQPAIIGYSLERNIIPRCAVLSLLMREGKIGPNVKLISALLGSANMFSTRYVLRYANELPDVVKAYEGKITFDGFREQDLLVPLKL